jgi:hypothetical protein
MTTAFTTKTKGRPRFFNFMCHFWVWLWLSVLHLPLGLMYLYRMAICSLVCPLRSSSSMLSVFTVGLSPLSSPLMRAEDRWSRTTTTRRRPSVVPSSHRSISVPFRRRSARRLLRRPLLTSSVMQLGRGTLRSTLRRWSCRHLNVRRPFSTTDFRRQYRGTGKKRRFGRHRLIKGIRC